MQIPIGFRHDEKSRFYVYSPMRCASAEEDSTFLSTLCYDRRNVKLIERN